MELCYYGEACPGCFYCNPPVLGDDRNYYTTLFVPSKKFKLQHEADEYCWCDPMAVYDEEGYVSFVHRLRQ